MQDEFAYRSQIKARARASRPARSATRSSRSVRWPTTATTACTATSRSTSCRGPTPRSRAWPSCGRNNHAQGGSVTAGNSSPISDGAAAALVMSRRAADQLGVKPPRDLPRVRNRQVWIPRSWGSARCRRSTSCSRRPGCRSPTSICSSSTRRSRASRCTCPARARHPRRQDQRARRRDRARYLFGLVLARES